MEATAPAAVLRWREEPVQLNTASKVEAGDALCKLVNPNLAWLAMILPSERLSGATTGDAVECPVSGDWRSGGARQDQRPWRAQQRNGTRMVVVAIDAVPTELALSEWLDAELLLVSRSGVIVPRSVLVTRDGQLGVYVLSRTSAYFRAVTVLVSVGSDVLVQGIDAGTALARLPWLWALLGRVR
ncbi:MAG: hypothetical protein MZU79_00760 [Anaerotruncus sp.]|nr:hypothetical protein [Anaerotruncus sp.]